jgi:hypothetical protein
VTDDQATWVGVTLGYACPSCGKRDRQAFVFDVPKYDYKYILHTAQSRMMPCNACNAELSKDLELEVNICLATREQLRKAGYPVYPIN